MTESIDDVQFAVTSVQTAQLATDFQARYHSIVDPIITPTVTLTLDKERPCPCDVAFGPAGFEVSLRLPEELDEETLQPFADLTETLDLVAWMKRAVVHSRFLAARIDMTYGKVQSTEEGDYVAYTLDGLEQIRADVRSRLARGEPPRGLAVRTPLLEVTLRGAGILCGGIDLTDRPELKGAFLVPKDAPEHFRTFFADVQADHLGFVLLQKDLGAAPAFTLGGVRAISEWLQSEELIAKLAALHMRKRDVPRDDEGLAALRKELETYKTDLLTDTVERFEAAKAGFREVSVELLRDLHKMRGEMLSLMGSDLFQTSLSIAATIAGLSLADLLDLSWSLALGILVGLLFFIGALSKAVTQELEFRQLVKFNREFSRLPLAQAMPEFRQWYAKTIERSISMFYATMAIGIAIAGIPLYGVASVWLSLRWAAGPPAAAIFGIAAGAAFGTCAVVWYLTPHRKVRITSET